MNKQRCKTLTQDTKQYIHKTFSKFVEKNGKSLNKSDIVKNVAEIFSVSESEVYKILKEGYDNLTATKRGNNKKNEAFWSYIFKKDLQRHIWELNSKNIYFTINDLLNHAKKELEFFGSRSTLYKILKTMGYKYKTVNNRKILCEQRHVVLARISFLRKYLQYLESADKIFVYLDETWIYENGSSKLRRWVHDTDKKSNPSKEKGEGKRFTVLHAGCSSGFLSGCEYLLHSNNNDRDYHKTMDGDLFKTWTEEQLLPALNGLEEKCVVIMDNAPYHSMVLDKVPTFSSRKDQMQAWLTEHEITFDATMTKKQLFDLIKPFRERPKTYVIDNILNRHGHDVLRLPPYHCQYNPIELAWGQCKSFYNKHINSQAASKDRVETLWREALSQCAANIWTKNIDHCNRLIKDDWQRHMGQLSINNIPPIIISLGDESDSELDFNDDYSDNDIDYETISVIVE